MPLISELEPENTIKNNVKKFSAYIISRFIFLDLTFKSLIYFELIFLYGIREWSSFILLHAAVQFFQNHFWRNCLFPIMYSCLLCHILIDHICRVLFSVFYPAPLICVSVFMLIPCYFDYYRFVLQFEIRNSDASSLFFFLKIALALWDLLCSIQMLGLFLLFWKKCRWNFDKDCTELLDCFG